MFAATGRVRGVTAIAACSILLATACSGDEDISPVPRSTGPGTLAVKACDVPKVLLERVSRGYVPGLSGDVLAIERLPHQFGSRHSSPHPYTQNIPVVLWGPGFIRPRGKVRKGATLADLAPTQAELLRFDEWPERTGRVLTPALVPRSERDVPRLIVTVVWDGGGDNVLKRWPKSWPFLKRLMKTGTSFRNATVGSSPSITPAAHASIGTGAFPEDHGIPDIKAWLGSAMGDPWAGDNPKRLRLDTLADLFDDARDGKPKMGLLARDAWHVGMIGHGAERAGGDRDIVALDDIKGIEYHTNESFYRLPGYLSGTVGLDAAIDEVDRRDGSADGKWRGHDLTTGDDFVRKTPAWSIYQTGRIREILEREGFGADEVPDLFFTNYKGTDLAGHQWNMIEPETKDNLREQDRQLKELVGILDELAGRGRYVLMLTADHGMTPRTFVRGGWSIDDREMTADIEARFDAKGLVVANRRYSLVLDHGVMDDKGIDAEDVARFIRNYRLRDNAPDGEVPDGYSEVADDRLYLTAMTPERLERALGCAAGKAG